MLYISTHINITGSVKVGIYFVIYEQLKHFLVPRIDEYLPSGTSVLMASGIAKVVFSIQLR